MHQADLVPSALSASIVDPSALKVIAGNSHVSSRLHCLDELYAFADADNTLSSA